MCVVVIYFSDTVYSMSVNDFFNSGWDSISSAWHRMIVAIKKPVRPRRLGSIGRRKTTTTTPDPSPIFSMDTTLVPPTVVPPTTIIKPTPTELIIPYAGKAHSSPNRAVSIEMPPEIRRIAFTENNEPVTMPGDGKVKVPYLPEPIWKTLEDWKQMQRPHFVKLLRSDKDNDGDFEALLTSTESKLTDVQENEQFGVLLFI
ncbi:uncharacterized protein LOC114350729 isoform X2 [Ostrinia furnacalis]|uniref:uncharacterized protein LOC114350729 isoform X2 n=1 Tax=Ostrinia furnacalis TaxID=93504 RepID=UPI0010401E67|nr:uncharacterized protein LOC114350729 isoform X2 [Ostrinia furnacalis]